MGMRENNHGSHAKRLVPDNVWLGSRLHTDFLTLCYPACVDQRGALRTSTHYWRKHLKSRGFNMRKQKRIVANNLGGVLVLEPLGNRTAIRNVGEIRGWKNVRIR